MTMWMDEGITRFSEQAARLWADGEGLGDEVLFGRLWELAAGAGLCRVGIPEAYGGRGGAGPEISEMVRRLTLATGNLGLPLALMISQLVAHFMLGALGSDSQKAAWLPPMAEGRFPSAFAVSEPKVGAHPGKLTTYAERVDDGWRLTGMKSYISNGPLAGLAVMVAVVGEEKGRKQFSAFLLDGDTPGVERSDAMALPFLRPSLHGNIRLDGVALGTGSVLGNPGNAYRELVLPFRRFEDAMMMGCVTGALRFVLNRLGDTAAMFDDAVCETAGKLAAHVTALERIARVSAALTADVSPSAEEESTALLIHFRQVAGCCRGLVTSLEEAGVALDPASRAVMDDLAATSGIAANIARAKQVKLGRACLTGEAEPYF